MKRRRVWRYSCDYCKKSNCSASAMSLHEKHCTMNPGRDCRMCNHGDCYQEDMITLIFAVREGLDILREVASGCPACMLAAIRQARKYFEVEKNDFDGFSYINDYMSEDIHQFNYKEEKASFWGDINDAEAEADFCSYAS